MKFVSSRDVCGGYCHFPVRHPSHARVGVACRDPSPSVMMQGPRFCCDQDDPAALGIAGAGRGHWVMRGSGESVKGLNLVVRNSPHHWVCHTVRGRGVSQH